MSLERLSLNQATIRRAELRLALDVARRHGVPAVGLWREPVEDIGVDQAARLVASSGLRVSSVCRGGFFTASDPGEWRTSLEDNRRAVDQTAAVAGAGAVGSRPVLGLVAGGLPPGSRDLGGARDRVKDALHDLAPYAEAAGVILALEPLHPMYAAERCVVSTLHQALDLVGDLPPTVAGVLIDSFHVWWDPTLEDAVARAGLEGRIAGFQVSDWSEPLPHPALLARALPGTGVLDLDAHTAMVRRAGFDGDVEVEVFRQEVWDADPDDVVAAVVRWARNGQATRDL